MMTTLIRSKQIYAIGTERRKWLRKHLYCVIFRMAIPRSIDYRSTMITCRKYTKNNYIWEDNQYEHCDKSDDIFFILTSVFSIGI